MTHRLSHRHPAFRVLLCLLSAAAVASCSKSSPTETGSDRVAVVSIQPPARTPLKAGSSVTFSATIDYRLSSAPSGTVIIVIQDQNSRNLSSTVPQPRVTVANGIGTVTLVDQIVIPAFGVDTVQVSFGLLPSDHTETQVVTLVNYPVVAPTSLGLSQAAHRAP